MDEREWLANRFEEHRPRLRALAYRMLGSPSEAEDAVQEAWLRLDRSGSDGIENLGGWLTTVVGRVCLNMLRSRASRREQFLDEPAGETPGARIPDPIVDREDGIDPKHQALLADGIGLALLVVLETLSRRAAGFCAARHLRGALRRDRTHRGAFLGRGQAARQPCTSPGAGRRSGPGR
jgi:RNA polymerase sigma factor (sigma-70 family)